MVNTKNPTTKVVGVCQMRYDTSCFRGDTHEISKMPLPKDARNKPKSSSSASQGCLAKARPKK